MLQLWALVAVLIFAITSKAIYNLWFHPLRAFPGPKIAGVSRLWYISKVIKGDHKHAILKLHDQYGDVVRIAPDELSYIDPRAWDDVYGKSAHENKAGGLAKDPKFFSTAFNEAESLVDNNSLEFKPVKKTAIRAFSRASLISRNHTMSSYIDRSIDAIRGYLRDKQESTIDINPWLGNLVLDTHTQLTMSQILAAIKLGPVQHSVVTNMHKAVTVIQYCTQLQYLPRMLTCLPGLIPTKDIFTVIGSVPPLGPAISDRLASADEPDDFASHMMTVDQKGGAANAPLVRKNCLIFILSAVETLPGYTCSILYYLLATPEYFARASKEVRSTFQKKEDITVGSAQTLEYLRTCMHEGLRVSPPFVGTLGRVVPRDGATICGQFVPGGTAVGIHNWSITHSENYWRAPDEFRPERWLGDEDYAADQREVFKPFGLVLLESTLILAKLLFDFDMTMDPASCGEWPNHAGHLVPSKGRLIVDAKPRKITA